jgi:hypothetical protein
MTCLAHPICPYRLPSNRGTLLALSALPTGAQDPRRSGSFPALCSHAVLPAGTLKTMLLSREAACFPRDLIQPQAIVTWNPDRWLPHTHPGQCKPRACCSCPGAVVHTCSLGATSMRRLVPPAVLFRAAKQDLLLKPPQLRQMADGRWCPSCAVKSSTARMHPSCCSGARWRPPPQTCLAINLLLHLLALPRNQATFLSSPSTHRPTDTARQTCKHSSCAACTECTSAAC